MSGEEKEITPEWTVRVSCLIIIGKLSFAFRTIVKTLPFVTEMKGLDVGCCQLRHHWVIRHRSESAFIRDPGVVTHAQLPIRGNRTARTICHCPAEILLKLIFQRRIIRFRINRHMGSPNEYIQESV